MPNDELRAELENLYDFACRYQESGKRPGLPQWTQLREMAIRLLRWGYDGEDLIKHDDLKKEVNSLPTIVVMEQDYPDQMEKLLSMYEGPSPSVGVCSTCMGCLPPHAENQ